MKKIILLLLSAVLSINAALSQEYDAHDLGKLKAFLVQPSAEEGKTNGEQLGLSAAEIADLDASYNWVSKVRGLTWTGTSPKRITIIDWEEKNLSGRLDVSDCAALTHFECISNQLTSLKINDCTSLNWLDCSVNQLISLDVSGCTALERLYCSFNQLTTLDVTGSTMLKQLSSSSNQLTTLDVTGNMMLIGLWCLNNPLTNMIVGWTTIPSFGWLYLPNVSSATLHVPVGTVPLYKADENWRDFSNIVEVGSGGTTPSQTYHSHDLGKLKAFLKQPSTQVEKTHGERLGLTKGDMATLDDNENWVANVRGVTWTKDVPKRIVTIHWYLNGLVGNLDLAGCMELIRLTCRQNHLTALDLTDCTALTELYCDANQLTALDLSHNTLLTRLGCQVNQLTALDLSHNTALTYLECPNNQLTSLNLSHNTDLRYLQCENNQLTSLDISCNTALTTLSCITNPLTDITVGWTTIPSFYVLSFPYSQSQITLNVPVGTVPLYKAANTWKKFGNIVEIGSSNEPPALSYHADDLVFLRSFLLQSSSESGKTNGEALGLSVSDLSTLGTSVSWVSKLSGVTWDDATPKRITRLAWSDRGLSGTLSISGLSSLTYLTASNNSLTSLDLSNTPLLSELWCNGNPLTSITVSWTTPIPFTGLGASSQLWLLQHLPIVSTATLYVPAGTKPLYQAAEGWGLFKEIVELGGNLAPPPAPVPPQIKFSGSMVDYGQSLAVTGERFTPNTSVQLVFSNSGESFTADVNTDENGGFTYAYNTAELGSGTIAVYGTEANSGVTSPTKKFGVNEEVKQDAATIRLVSPSGAENFRTQSIIYISWNDKMERRNGECTYQTNSLGKRLYSYTVECQYSKDGPWKEISRVGNNHPVGMTLPTTIMEFVDTPTDHFRVRITDNYCPANSVTSEVCKVFSSYSSAATSLQWDYSFQQPLATQPVGVAADGVARLFVKVADEQSNIKSVSATLSDEFGNTKPNLLGKLHPASNVEYSLEANGVTTTFVNNVAPDRNGIVWLWYVAPDDFVESPESAVAEKDQRTVKITLIIERNDGTKETQTLDVAVVRPPLMLVHGLGGDEHTWDKFKYSVNNTTQLFKESPLFKRIKTVKLRPYTLYRDNALILLDANHMYDLETAYATNSLQDNINVMRGMGYASNQVDYVCHSMGGCVLRTAMTTYENIFYGRGVYSTAECKSYDKGFVHKLITIDTPHNGSPLADFVNELVPQASTTINIALTALYHTSSNTGFIKTYFSPVDPNKPIYNFEGTPAVKNLQVMGEEGYRLQETHVKHHFIAGDIDLYTAETASQLSSMKDYLAMADKLWGIARDITPPGTAKTVVSAMKTLNQAARAVSFVEWYSEQKGFPNYLGDGDAVVPLASQLGRKEIPSAGSVQNMKIFKNSNKLYNANHLFITDRSDVGDQVKDLLNTKVSSSLFGDVISAHPFPVKSRSSLVSEPRVQSEPYFDRTHIEIISPSRGDRIRVNETVELVYRIKETTNLAFTEYLFQGNNGINAAEGELQRITLNVSPDFLGNQTIYVIATYDEADKTVTYIDTVTVDVFTDEALLAFRVEPEVAQIYVGEEYFPVLTAVYETFLSNISSGSSDLRVSVNDPATVRYDAARHCFVGLKSSSTYATISYGNFSVPLYFNVLPVAKAIDEGSTGVLGIESGSVLDDHSLQLTISPNPVYESFTLRVVNAADNVYPLTVTIYDIEGKKLSERIFDTDADNFPISDYSSGIYIVRVITSSGHRASVKLLKK
jgi:pimeloyl-ACP methyl ester carboxylesterase